MTPKLIRLDDNDLRENNIPLSAKTLRNFRSKGKWPDLFVKIEGIVCINMDEWHRIVTEAIEQQRKG